MSTLERTEHIKRNRLFESRAKAFLARGGGAGKGGATHVRDEAKALIKEALDTIEDLRDVAAYDHAKARDEEIFPSDLLKRMLDGDSPLKVFREYRGLSQAALAVKSGVERSMIAKIETTKREGSISTLKKLAHALELDIDDLV